MFPCVTGIVAEYNPLHTGHVFHLDAARRATAADAIIVVLSADFVQRGQPALLAMHDRAKLAVECGADLVVELPALFACHNAGVFAGAAMRLLDATGVITALSYGAEQTDWDINALSDILVEEPNSFKAYLKKNLQSGFSFAEARVMALDCMCPGTASILQGSNNSLALNYAVWLKKTGSKIKPVAIKRYGAFYDDQSTDGDFASAAAIRKLLAENNFDTAKRFLPENCARLLGQRLAEGNAWLDFAKLWTALRTLLLRSASDELSQCGEMSEGIENKLKTEALTAANFEQWLEHCTGKRYPSGRIRRQAMQLLLGVDHWTNRAVQRLGVPYIRILAMNTTGQKLVRLMQKRAKLPIITRCGEARFSAYAKRVMSFDLLASELRRGFLPNANAPAPHTEKIYIKQ